LIIYFSNSALAATERRHASRVVNTSRKAVAARVDVSFLSVWDRSTLANRLSTSIAHPEIKVKRYRIEAEPAVEADAEAAFGWYEGEAGAWL